jgi:hypothetical protein
MDSSPSSPRMTPYDEEEFILEELYEDADFDVDLSKYHSGLFAFVFMFA